MKNKKVFAIVMINVFLIIALRSSVDVAVAKPQGVVLQGITRHNSAMYGAFETTFKSMHPEVDDIQWLEITTNAQWISAIVSPSYSIDILWGGGPTVFNIVADAGYMLPFQDQELIDFIEANVSETIAGGDMMRRDGSGNILWVGAALSSFGYTVNHENLAAYGLPVPQSWEELASTEYFLGTNTHAIGMGDAPETTSNTRVYQIILQKYGWEAGWDILTRMAANSMIFDSSDNTRDSVVTGSQAVAMTIDFYGYQAQIQNPDCEYIIPEGQSIVNADPIAIASSSVGEDRVWAEEFVKFVMSPEGQAIWLDLNFNRLPIIPEAFNKSLAVNGYTRDDLYQSYLDTLASASTDFDEDLATEIYDIVTFYFHGSFTQTTTQLYSAWQLLVNAYEADQISEEEFRSLSRELAVPLISLQKAKELQLDYQINPNIKDTLYNQFRSAAISRYTGIGTNLNLEKADTNNDGIYFNELKATITSPIANQIVAGKVYIDVDVVDYRAYSFAYGITKVAVSVDGTNIANITTPSHTEYGLSTFNTIWNSSLYSDGSHSISIDAYEYSGRSVSKSISVSVNEEKPLPVASISTPAMNATVNGTILIQASASEDLTFIIDRISIQIVGTAFVWDIDTDFLNIVVSFNTSLVADGTHIIRMIVYYLSGNTQTLDVNIIIKNAEPDTTWQAPGFEGLSLILSIMTLLGFSCINRKRG